jgi:hypothetical protein
MTSQHHVFLSYSRKDTDLMTQIRDDLRAAGLTVWTDEGIEVGTPLWKDAIEKAIEDASCLVVILSPDSKQSIWVKRELDYAAAQGKQIFALMSRGNDSNAVPFALIGSQYIDIRTQYERGKLSIVNRLYQHLAIEPQTPETTQPPNAESILSVEKRVEVQKTVSVKPPQAQNPSILSRGTLVIAITVLVVVTVVVGALINNSLTQNSLPQTETAQAILPSPSLSATMETATFTPTMTSSPTPSITITITPTNDTPTQMSTSTDEPSDTPRPSATSTTTITSTPLPTLDGSSPGEFVASLKEQGIIVSTMSSRLATEVPSTVINLNIYDNIIRTFTFEGQYENFILNTTIEWGAGVPEDSCGFRFRTQDSNNIYSVLIDRNQNLLISQNVFGSSDWFNDINFNGNILAERNQLNTLMLVVSDDTFTVFVNGTFAHTFTDNTMGAIEMSLAASTYDESDAAGCNFTDTWVWDLDAPAYVTPAGDIANIRQSPNTDADIVDVRSHNEYIVVISQSNIEGTIWYLVELDDTTGQGWVSSQAVTISPINHYIPSN